MIAALTRANWTIVAFAVLTIGVLGCGSNKPLPTDDPPDIAAEDTTSVDDAADTKEPIITRQEVIETAPSRSHVQTRGVIKDYSLKGCGFLIEVDLMGRKTLFQPELLDADFMKDGLPVTFNYTKARRPVTCEGAIPIIIDAIQ